MTLPLGGQQIPVDLHLDVVLLCAGLVLGYVGLLRRYGPLLQPRRDEPIVTRRQVWSFGAGVVALWIASGSPLHTLADEYLFSAHMVQHLLQAFVIAPLLLMGIPGWMLEVVTSPRWLRSTLRTLGAPLVAGIVFNVVLLGIHWPPVMTLMVRNETFHATMHTSLLLASLLMWLPVVSNSDVVQPRMQPLGRMGYLLCMTILPTVPASFMTFGDPDVPLYPIYAEFPRLWDMPVGEDILIAGLIMKVGGGFLLWGIIAGMFFRWAADQERHEASNRPALVTTGPRSD